MTQSSFYVTYGYGTDRRRNYSVIEAGSYEEARSKAMAETGGQFAFLYDEEGFRGQPEAYGLTPIALGPQCFTEEP